MSYPFEPSFLLAKYPQPFLLWQMFEPLYHFCQSFSTFIFSMLRTGHGTPDITNAEWKERIQPPYSADNTPPNASWDSLSSLLQGQIAGSELTWCPTRPQDMFCKAANPGPSLSCTGQWRCSAPGAWLCTSPWIAYALLCCPSGRCRFSYCSNRNPFFKGYF